MGLLFTSAKSRASFCHFYVVINRLGLCARSVQSTNLLPDILYVCLSYVMLTGVPSGGCSHGDDTANNPIKKECSFKSPDICIHTHTDSTFTQEVVLANYKQAWHSAFLGQN